MIDGSSRPHNLQKRSLERALFAKNICNSYDDAIALLKERNLGPGDIAVVRYYVNGADEWNTLSGLPIRMVMGIGGANTQADDDVFIFNDSRAINGSESVSEDVVNDMINSALSGYYNKAEINALLNSDEQWKTLVTNRLNNMDNDIDEIRSKVDAISTDGFVTYEIFSNELVKKANKEDVYTKAEVNKIVNDIDIPEVDLSDYYTKEDVDNRITDSLNEYITEDELLAELDNKVDITEFTELSETIDNKVDASYVEEYFNTNVGDNVDALVKSAIEEQNIADQVNTAVDEKLKDFEGVTTETIDDVLESNEYFITEVLTPIETITEQVKLIETQIKDLDADIDGGSEEDWEI